MRLLMIRTPTATEQQAAEQAQQEEKVAFLAGFGFFLQLLLSPSLYSRKLGAKKLAAIIHMLQTTTVKQLWPFGHPGHSRQIW